VGQAAQKKQSHRNRQIKAPRCAAVLCLAWGGSGLGKRGQTAALHPGTGQGPARGAAGVQPVAGAAPWQEQKSGRLALCFLAVAFTPTPTPDFFGP